MKKDLESYCLYCFYVLLPLKDGIMFQTGIAVIMATINPCKFIERAEVSHRQASSSNSNSNWCSYQRYYSIYIEH